jgi:hypothetical protein
VSLPGDGEEIAVERTTFLARAVAANGANGPRVLVHLAPESADRLADAHAAGWKAL